MGIFSSQFFVYLRTRDLSEITSDGNDGEQKQTPENSLKATDELRNGEQNQQENPEQSFQTVDEFSNEEKGYQNKCDETTSGASGSVGKNFENAQNVCPNEI